MGSMLDSPVNTNMYVEAFHRVLKYVYLKGKVNKRLDKCLGILLNLNQLGVRGTKGL